MELHIYTFMYIVLKGIFILTTNNRTVGASKVADLALWYSSVILEQIKDIHEHTYKGLTKNSR